MSLDTALFIGLGIFLGLSVILQIYLAYRLRKYRQAPTQTSGHMTAKESFRFGLFHTLFYGSMLIVALYNTWTGKFSLPLGIGLGIVGLMSIRKPLALVRDHRPVHADAAVSLPLFPRATNTVTPELIQELLADETLVNAIRKDLEMIHQIRGHEQWRLGLITSETDTFNSLYQIPVKRAAMPRNQPWASTLRLTAATASRRGNGPAPPLAKCVAARADPGGGPAARAGNARRAAASHHRMLI